MQYRFLMWLLFGKKYIKVFLLCFKNKFSGLQSLCDACLRSCWVYFLDFCFSILLEQNSGNHPQKPEISPKLMRCDTFTWPHVCRPSLHADHNFIGKFRVPTWISLERQSHLHPLKMNTDSSEQVFDCWTDSPPFFFSLSFTLLEMSSLGSLFVRACHARQVWFDFWN